jgi:hypothetical protein
MIGVITDVLALRQARLAIPYHSRFEGRRLPLHCERGLAGPAWHQHWVPVLGHFPSVSAEDWLLDVQDPADRSFGTGMGGSELLQVGGSYIRLLHWFSAVLGLFPALERSRSRPFETSALK